VNDPRARIDALFDRALDLDADARAAFLAELAAHDPASHAELETLLRLAHAPGSRLDPHAIVAGPLWQALAEADPGAGDAAQDAVEPGQRIGAWRVVRPLGQGGMGAVYLAERVEGGFDQYGALKRIRSGIDSAEFLRRFAQERQILAALGHAGIARLLDGGRDAAGRPYLVMEYVAGDAIDRHCDAHALGIDARLALFAQVGRAVAHAHRHLVVHRDLKPSNIVVTAEGEVKLLDFGIATVLDASGAPATPPTRTAARVFTPEYAAPEQVLGQAITTATDVYQLGLLLHELLSGLRAQRFVDATPAALQRAVCDTEPPRPSAAIDARAAALRGTSARALRRRLQGDLDTIVAKALRKAPERRYASAAELVDDIERWRQGKPIRARPESLAYRGRKFVRRHPFGVSGAAGALLLLVAYAATVTLQAGTIARERDRARAEAAKAQQVKALVLRLFAGADPQQSGGAQLSARELLDRGWDGIERDLGAQPEVRAELLDTVGEAYRQLGEYQRAQPMFEQALSFARTRAQADPLRLAHALRSRGRLHGDLGEFEQARALLHDALARYRAQLGTPHAEVATTLGDLGFALTRAADYRAAERMHRDALAMRRALFGDEHPDVADSLVKLGMTLRNQGDYAAAEPMLSEALALRRRLLPPTHPQLAHTLSDLALLRADLGEPDSAEALYRESLDLIARVHGARHPHVATVMNNLARLLQAQRRFGEARGLLQQALEIRTQALGSRHQSVAMTLNDLGQVLAELGDGEAALAHYRQALRTYPPGHPWRAATILNLGRLAQARGDVVQAERLYREALAGQRAHYGADHDRVAKAMVPLGALLHRQGRLEEAEPLLRQALAIYRTRLGADHARVAGALVPLGELLSERGQHREASNLLRDAVRIHRRAFGEHDPRTRETVQALERAATGRGPRRALARLP
jgi:tetratricopeptide (TPR) repeat protein